MTAWIITDTDGRIDIVSREARQLLGRALLRGACLVETLALPRRAALFDIEVALTGWPAERCISIDWLTRQPSRLRYYINRRLPAHGPGLYWEFRWVEASAIS